MSSGSLSASSAECIACWLSLHGHESPPLHVWPSVESHPQVGWRPQSLSTSCGPHRAHAATAGRIPLQTTPCRPQRPDQTPLHYPGSGHKMCPGWRSPVMEREAFRLSGEGWCSRVFGRGIQTLAKRKMWAGRLLKKVKRLTFSRGYLIRVYYMRVSIIYICEVVAVILLPHTTCVDY